MTDLKGLPAEARPTVAAVVDTVGKGAGTGANSKARPVCKQSRDRLASVHAMVGQAKTYALYPGRSRQTRGAKGRVVVRVKRERANTSRRGAQLRHGSFSLPPSLPALRLEIRALISKISQDSFVAHLAREGQTGMNERIIGYRLYRSGMRRGQVNMVGRVRDPRWKRSGKTVYVFVAVKRLP